MSAPKGTLKRENLIVSIQDVGECWLGKEKHA